MKTARKLTLNILLGLIIFSIYDVWDLITAAMLVLFFVHSILIILED